MLRDKHICPYFAEYIVIANAMNERTTSLEAVAFLIELPRHPPYEKQNVAALADSRLSFYFLERGWFQEEYYPSYLVINTQHL